MEIKKFTVTAKLATTCQSKEDALVKLSQLLRAVVRKDNAVLSAESGFSIDTVEEAVVVERETVVVTSEESADAKL